MTPVTNDDGSVTYQASSPDEVAIVQWTESVGLTLVSRDRTSMTLQTPSGSKVSFDILLVFPFTSESKRMGIIVRNRDSGEITFVQKGADVIMSKIVQKNDWLDEECGNMAREGLRTLVLGRKKLSAESYVAFEAAYKLAQLGEGRAAAMARVVGEYLENELELLALTGVEDKLQEDVKSTLELLRNAGLRIWMLTGDKIETATNIAVSSKLVSRNQYIHQVAKCELFYPTQNTIGRIFQNWRDRNVLIGSEIKRRGPRHAGFPAGQIGRLSSHRWRITTGKSGPQCSGNGKWRSYEI